MAKNSVNGLLLLAVGVAIFLVTSSPVLARSNMPFQLILGEDAIKSGEGEACCDKCFCTRSNPPQCRCMDMTVYCPSSCKEGCICNKKLPPDCQCLDIKNYCDKSCTAAA